MFTQILLTAAALTADPAVAFQAPARHIVGGGYRVIVTIDVPAEGAVVPAWMLSPAAFTVDGEPLAARAEEVTLDLAPGAELSLAYDLAPFLAERAAGKASFELGLPGAEPQAVTVAEAAPAGLDFMTMPVEELADYQVVMTTSAGDLVMEFWPEAAPGHVRNYLDLCYTKFYDGLTFHRVIPGFMIQGGDPDGNGTGSGPRNLQAEFSQDPKYKHQRGVLSMARSADPNSASCQFFVMHQAAPHLDGQYSAFGRCTDGLEVVDAIVSTPRNMQTNKPNEPQRILRAVVIKAPRGE
jgi:peptidyl-prolyl cis-trans isomerase B (cyclophilin B)